MLADKAGTGFIATIAGSILICNKFGKAKEIVNEFKQEREDFEAMPMIEDEKKKKIVKLYFKTGGKLVKVFVLPIGVLAAGGVCIYSSVNNLEKKFEAAKVAATGAMGVANHLMENIEKKYGPEELDRLLSDEPIEEKEQVKSKKKKKEEFEPTYRNSIYGFMFDESCYGFVKNDPITNVMELRSIWKAANDRYARNGVVFKSWLDDAFGKDETIAGRIVGKVRGLGDLQFSLGLPDIEVPDSEFDISKVTHDYSKPVYINPNWDGTIIGSEELSNLYEEF